MAIYMLISFRNPLVNLFQAVMTVFFFACNTHKLVYRAPNRMAISTSHSTLHGHLDRLGRSAIARLREVGKRAYESASNLTQESHQYFALVFDNVNKFHLARTQTVASKNQMKNGTAATAIILEDILPNAFDAKPYWDSVKSQCRQSITVNQLLDDIDPEHLASVATGMVMRTLCSYVPSLAGHLRHAVEEHFRNSDAYAKHRLRLRKTTTMSMGTSSIDESTAAGVSDILHDLVSTQMDMQPSWFDRLLILVGGDQLTVDGLQKAICYRATERDVYESRSWALPVIQLWHMKLAYLRSIMKAHWFDKVGTQLLGFRQSVDAIGRRINAEKCDFYPCHYAAKTVFEGMVLTAT